MRFTFLTSSTAPISYSTSSLSLSARYLPSSDPTLVTMAARQYFRSYHHYSPRQIVCRREPSLPFVGLQVVVCSSCLTVADSKSLRHLSSCLAVADSKSLSCLSSCSPSPTKLVYRCRRLSSCIAVAASKSVRRLSSCLTVNVSPSLRRPTFTSEPHLEFFSRYIGEFEYVDDHSAVWFFVLTTSAGIMDHEEARRKNVGGKVPAYQIVSNDSGGSGEEDGGRVDREIRVNFSIGGRRRSSGSDSNLRFGNSDAAEAGSVNGGRGDSDSESID
ncbi:40S ribosomal protein S15a-4 [Linum perenne]